MEFIAGSVPACKNPMRMVQPTARDRFLEFSGSNLGALSMRTRFAPLAASAVLMAASATAQQQPQQPRPVTPPAANEARADDRTTPEFRSEKSMTAAQAAEMFRSARHSLADGIGVAERTCGGKAVAAHCCTKTSAELEEMRLSAPKKSPAGRPDIARGGTPSEPNERKRDEQDRTIDQNRGAAETGKGPVCVVTCLVGDDRLVELIICSQSGQVLAQRQVNSIAGRQVQSSNAYDSNVRTSDGDARFDHLPVQAAVANVPQSPGVHESVDSPQREIDRRDVTRQLDRRSDRGFVMASRTQKASDLIGKPVRNVENEDLGKLEDIAIDPQSGRAIYGVLSFGGFLGMGDKLFAIPWSSLSLPSDAQRLVLNVSKDSLKTAEGFDKSNWPNMADTRWAADTHRYYSATPYWQSGDADVATPDSPSRADERSRWYAQSRSWQKCSDLIGKHVRSRTSEDVGEMRNVVIDPDSGRAVYGVIEYRSKRFAIPWAAFSLSADAKYFQLNVDTTKLLDSVAFNDSNWPDMTDRRWATEIHRYYGVDPYWPANDEISRRP
jgi:sporulation protein YlmC with PRC-barrel domain